MSSQIRSLAFVVNAQKEGAVALAQEVAAYCRGVGIDVITTTEYPLPDDFLKGRDACCVFGGDGTLLSTVPQATRNNVPVFGINQGKLGFLVTIGVDEALHRIKRFLAGEFSRDERSVLQCQTSCSQTGLALNDVVIKHGTMAPIVGLRVFADGDVVSRFYSDGIIFSTPTGSTAYNLSAGGPIIHPSARVIAMTPICPHTLTNRAVILPHSVNLEIECADQDPMPSVNIDGRLTINGKGAFPLKVSLLPHTFTILHPPGYSYFDILRTKLQWGGK